MEDQSLVIESIARTIFIIKLAKVHVPFLSDKVVIRQAEQIILNSLGRLLVWIDRHKSKALPLLIQQARILVPATVETKPSKLRIDIEVEERAIFRCGDTTVELAF